MILNQIEDQAPFTTADGSTIRSILDLTNAPVENQSLAEATLPPGSSTERHYHKASEEIYYIIGGTGVMELDGETSEVRAGDAILIPPGSWHQITAGENNEIRLLCCCSPPYSHEDTFFE